jgi:biotin transport system permease protein
MAELTAFGYRSGDSLLHSLDVRTKILCLIVISLTSLKAYPTGLSILTAVSLALIINARLLFRDVSRELRYFLVLLFFVFFARALSMPGTPALEWQGIILTREGLYNGMLISWRLLLVVLLGASFVATTKPSEIRAAVEWFLKPFPFIPRKRIATMIGLIIRFVPAVLDQARETSDAQRARGIENRKNPVYRLKKLAVPLLCKTFQNAEELAVAMEARCYSENRTDPSLSSTINDRIALFLVACLCIPIAFF